VLAPLLRPSVVVVVGEIAEACGCEACGCEACNAASQWFTHGRFVFVLL
jgi:hypothetical protein